MKKLSPVPVILGSVIVFLAAVLVRVESPMLRLRASDVAVFLSVLFFHSLEREDIEKLQERVQELEDLV